MSAYANAAPLRNPASDARAIGGAFRRLGFAEVIEREDLTRAKLEEVLKDFGDKAADADQPRSAGSKFLRTEEFRISAVRDGRTP
jgi:uncharacterized caspase-like protein